MNLKLFLEYLLSEQAIDEAAVGVAQARVEQLAIVPWDQGGKVIVLYKPSEILREADKELAAIEKEKVGFYKKHGVPASDNRREIDIFNVLGKSIVGIVAFHKSSKNVYEVQLTGADSGYGPLVYDLALSILDPNFLISDRRSVSRTAKKVWEFYLNNRTDVEKQPFKPSYDVETMDVSADKISADLHRSIENCRYLISKYKDDITYFSAINKSGRAAALRSRSLDADRHVAEYRKKLRQCQEKYAKLKAKYDEKLAKNPLSYMYRIKRPKSFASLSNAHNKLMVELESRIPKFRPGEFLEKIGARAEDLATMRLH